MESAHAAREMLNPSDLGTKAYWDRSYSRELENHKENAGDEGTVWFSECSAEEAVLKHLDSLEADGRLCRGLEDTRVERNASRVLDLGTGNGHMLFTLRDEDWHGEMVGVDYSPTAIHLARRIAQQRRIDDAVRFETWDLLTETAGDWLHDGFDVVLDKGTFDAVSLMDMGIQGRPCDLYRNKVAPLVKPGMFLVVTSCNWTKAELVQWLAPGGGDLRYHSEVKYPSYTFGGQTGQTIVTISFRRDTASSDG